MRKISVLMVDDEEQFRKTTSKILSKRGYETTMAATGEEAVEILRKAPHDVVVLDVRMPGMDGHKALHEIRKIRPDTQVIMLTGHGGMDSAQASLELGAFDYLNKPCDVDLLASKINSAYAAAAHGHEPASEKCAGQIMIRIEDYTTITENSTVTDAIRELMRSFEGLISSSRVMETGHRSVLVFDESRRDLLGFLSIQDLIREVRPAYLSAPRPSMADSVQYSAMFWTGLFTTQTKVLGGKKVGDVMSEEAPPTADEGTNLMDLANLMHTQGARRVVITKEGEAVGVVREQELFFEMADILL